MSDEARGAGVRADPVGAVGADLRSAATAAGAKANEAVAGVRDQAAQVAGRVGEEARGVADAATERAESLAEQGKAAGAERAEGLAHAVRRVADDLEETSPEIARHVRTAAESVEQVGAALRERSVGDLLGQVGEFARRQPTAFFAAAVVAGFAVSRFAKSSAEGSGGTGRAVAVRGGGHDALAARSTASGAPGWVPGKDATGHPATMAAASLGGAVAHRRGDAAPGTMPGPGDAGAV